MSEKLYQCCNCKKNMHELFLDRKTTIDVGKPICKECAKILSGTFTKAAELLYQQALRRGEVIQDV